MPLTGKQTKLCSAKCRSERKNEHTREYRLNNPEKMKEYDRRRRQNNREKRKENARNYRLNNKEKIKEYNRTYRLNNLETVKKHAREYHLNNLEKIKKYQHNYHLNNLEKLKARARERYLNNPEKWKEYRLNNLEKVKEYLRKYYLNNLERRREYRQDNIEKIKEYDRKRYRRGRGLPDDWDLSRESSIEIIMQRWLQDTHIGFMKQHYINLKKLGASYTRVDFFLEPNICFYCDGNYYHELEGRQESDARINRALESGGYIVIRLSESDILAGVRPIEILELIQ